LGKAEFSEKATLPVSKPSEIEVASLKKKED
jgi:hypothetical protein